MNVNWNSYCYLSGCKLYSSSVSVNNDNNKETETLPPSPPTKVVKPDDITLRPGSRPRSKEAVVMITNAINHEEFRRVRYTILHFSVAHLSIEFLKRIEDPRVGPVKKTTKVLEPGKEVLMGTSRQLAGFEFIKWTIKDKVPWYVTNIVSVQRVGAQKISVILTPAFPVAPQLQIDVIYTIVRHTSFCRSDARKPDFGDPFEVLVMKAVLNAFNKRTTEVHKTIQDIGLFTIRSLNLTFMLWGVRFHGFVLSKYDMHDDLNDSVVNSLNNSGVNPSIVMSLEERTQLEEDKTKIILAERKAIIEATEEEAKSMVRTTDDLTEATIKGINKLREAFPDMELKQVIEIHWKQQQSFLGGESSRTTRKKSNKT